MEAPPFNSNANYNVLFKEASGESSRAQFHAFTDTWEWTADVGAAHVHELSSSSNDLPNGLALLKNAHRQFDRVIATSTVPSNSVSYHANHNSLG